MDYLPIVWILIALAYIAVGIFICAAMNGCDEYDDSLSPLIIFLWPLAIVILMLFLLIFKIPYFLGKKVGMFLRDRIKQNFGGD